MDLAPVLDPDPTPFFRDFKDAKRAKTMRIRIHKIQNYADPDPKEPKLFGSSRIPKNFVCFTGACCPKR
jgi:hypothetical protein